VGEGYEAHALELDITESESIEALSANVLERRTHSGVEHIQKE
jgi:hypothetical protein